MKTEIVATAIIMIGIGLTGFQVVYAQVLDRDVEAPTSGLNGTAGAPPNVSIDISPLEELPINGTVTMSLEDVADTNMNEIPPPGVTVIISNEAVTVTNHPVTIEETETETEEPETETDTETETEEPETETDTETETEEPETE
jgi:hypothetical protein